LRLEQILDERNWPGFPAYLGALFLLAVTRRLGSGDRGDIIRFVADVRAKESRWSYDPSVADMETPIRRVFDPAVEFSLDPQALGAIETLVVYRILVDEELSDENLDALLNEAETLAEVLQAEADAPAG